MPGSVDLVTDWEPDPLAAAVILAAAWLYHSGVVKLSRKRTTRRWPPGRNAAFAGALTAATVATQSGIAAHEHTWFVAHMTQHVLLAMVVPLLVALGAPVTLALQTAPDGPRYRLRRGLHSRLGRGLTHPLVGWTLYGGGMVALYLTPLLDLAVRHPLLHIAVHAHMALVGLVFLTPLLGIDAVPRRLPHGVRLLAVLLAAPFHTIVGMALLSATTPVAPVAYPDLADQHAAAALYWTTGEVFTLCVAAIVLRQWWTAEQRAGLRELDGDARSQLASEVALDGGADGANQVLG